MDIFTKDTAKNMHFISQTVNHTDDDKIRHTFMGGGY